MKDRNFVLMTACNSNNSKEIFDAFDIAHNNYRLEECNRLGKDSLFEECKEADAFANSMIQKQEENDEDQNTILYTMYLKNLVVAAMMVYEKKTDSFEYYHSVKIINVA